MKRLVLASATLLAAACGGSDDDPLGKLDGALSEYVEAAAPDSPVAIAVWAEYEASPISSEALAGDDAFQQLLDERKAHFYAATDPIAKYLEDRGYAVTRGETTPSLTVVVPVSVLLDLAGRPDVARILTADSAGEVCPPEYAGCPAR